LEQNHKKGYSARKYYFHPIDNSTSKNYLFGPIRNDSLSHNPNAISYGYSSFFSASSSLMGTFHARSAS